jgi:hypothetical protein
MGQVASNVFQAQPPLHSSWTPLALGRTTNEYFG